MQDNRLQEAVRLLQSGKVEAAREQLELIIKNDRSNIAAWHWYAQSWSGAKEKARIWQACLHYNPANEQARQALRQLNVDPEKQKNPQGPGPAVAAPKPSLSSTRWLWWVMIGLLALVAAFVWLGVKTPASIDPQKYRHVQPYEYYLYVPKAYSADKEWPLFVGIHGAGGNGLQCWQLWQRYAEKEGFILLCPSIPGESFGFRLDVGETVVWSAIQAVEKEYRIKPRKFFSGFSAGAYFVQAFAYHYPRAVSGLSILSAGMYVDPMSFSEVVPTLVVIGGSDDPISVQESRKFVDGLKRNGFNVQYKIMPGVGHAVTQEGVNMTIDLFRQTVGK